MAYDKKANDRRYRLEHKKEIAKQQKIYYKDNRDKITKRVRKWEKENRPKLKNRHLRYYLKKYYNITVEQFEHMKISQDNKCSICSSAFKDRADCCVDHNHINGKLRELLCRKCNLMLGYVNDNPNILRYAINYLSKWR